MPLTQEKLRSQLPLLSAAAWRAVEPLHGTLYLRTSPQPLGGPAMLNDAAWQPLDRGGEWGMRWQTVWLKQTLSIPAELRDQPLWLHLRWRADAHQWSPDVIEAQVFVDDTILCGLDAEHRLAPLPAGIDGATLYLQAHVSQPQPFGGLELVVLDEPTDQLFHSLRVGLGVVEQLAPDSLAHGRLLHRLNEAYRLLDLRNGPGSAEFYASVRDANAYLAEHLPGEIDGGTRPQVVVTGHAHIDVAWLWPLWRTRQKTAHTFSTVLRLMERYPDFRFTASTPQLYAFVKEDYPKLYAEVKARIAEGRWEAIGGMWLEADCNLPSGESLVRQFVFGRRFFDEEFGIEDRVLWMPDVFGYSGALPQIMRGCGIDTFMTTKISWSQFNRMPFDTFRWRGIDGSEVLAHFVTTPDPNNGYYTYNGYMTPADVAGAWREYRQKALNDELLHLMGYGDGGGGPTTAQIETAQRLADVPGLPQVRFGSAADYFARLHERVDADPRLPVWVGELYLEYHRGTYTSQSWIKAANRRAEQLYHDAEFLDALAATTTAYQSQRERLNEGWQLILLNQFHDILPGSSIAQVYADAREQFATIEALGQAVRDEALAALADSVAEPLVVNTLGWERADVLLASGEPPLGEMTGGQLQRVTELDGSSATLIANGQVAPYSVAPLAVNKDDADEALRITERSLENRWWRIELDEAGEIASLWDKRNDREVIAPGTTGNQLVAFEDRPLRYDAWDIDIYYEEKAYPLREVERIEVVEAGPLRGGVEITRRFLSSTVRQRLLVYRDQPRIDFATEIDWHEHQLLLKAAFPCALNVTRATHEIQFGSVERPTHRNTSWDVARFETSAHRWVDLGEGGYGVALLNDAKYGHDVHDNVVRLTLLKSGIYPDPGADQGVQRFTYALLPHSGDWRDAEVPRRAAELNAPLRLWQGNAGGSHRAQTGSRLGDAFVRCDAPNVVVDTVKTAEDGDGLIVRVYEAHNRRGEVNLRFPRQISSAEECNLLEQRSADARTDGASLSFAIKPFEIKTFRLRFAPLTDQA